MRAKEKFLELISEKCLNSNCALYVSENIEKEFSFAPQQYDLRPPNFN